MANVILGKVAITWKGEFDTNLTYHEQDVVSNGADTFICKVAQSTSGAFDVTEWDTFAQGTRDVATTPGDLIYHDGYQLRRLPIGNEGEVLSINADTNMPEWVTPYTTSSNRVKSLLRFEGVPMNGYEQFCMMEDDSVRCWGLGGHYGLGLGTSNSSRPKTHRMPFPLGFPGIAYHAVDNTPMLVKSHQYGFALIDKNGDLWTWGENQNGVCGTNSNNYMPKNVMKRNDGANPLYDGNPGATKVVDVQVPCGSQNNNCMAVIGVNGLLYMTGYNAHGQLGRGDTSESSWFVKSAYFDNLKTSEGVTVEKVRLGRAEYTHGLSIDSTGRLHVWGYNGDYQLGNNSSTNAATPFHLNSGSITNQVVTDIWAGPHSSFCRLADKSLHVWGGDRYGSHGIGVNSGSSTVNSSSRIPVPSTDDVELFCHDTYYDYPASYIYKTDNKLYSTGYNGVGNLGVGDTSARASWTEVDMSMFKNGELPIKIFCNGQNGHNVFGVLTDQGRVYACGYNGYGQLGVGDQSNKTRLTEAICDKFIVDAIFVGHERYMNLHVLTSDGQLLISGCGDNYQLAMPHSTEYPSLAPVAF